MPLLDLSASGGRLTNNHNSHAVVGQLTNNIRLDFHNFLVLKLSFCALEAHQ
jgi:hypothetical protein